MVYFPIVNPNWFSEILIYIFEVIFYDSFAHIHGVAYEFSSSKNSFLSASSAPTSGVYTHNIQDSSTYNFNMHYLIFLLTYFDYVLY